MCIILNYRRDGPNCIETTGMLIEVCECVSDHAINSMHNPPIIVLPRQQYLLTWALSALLPRCPLSSSSLSLRPAESLINDSCKVQQDIFYVLFSYLTSIKLIFGGALCFSTTPFPLHIFHLLSLPLSCLSFCEPSTFPPSAVTFFNPQSAVVPSIPIILNTYAYSCLVIMIRGDTWDRS